MRKTCYKILRMVFSRMGLILILLLLNVGLVFSVFRWFESFLPHVYGGTAVFIAAMVLYLINRKMDATSKITWLVLIMLSPVLGSLLFLFTEQDFGHRAMARRLQKIQGETKITPVAERITELQLEKIDCGAASLVRYASSVCSAQVYQNTQVTYFPIGEEKLNKLLTELEKAESYIYLEYFIIAEGTMWDQILAILCRKAKQGVDVRILYDGTCEFLLLPKNYPQKLKKMGIHCKVFAPATPLVSTHYNYRDHRKIVVIDGHTAFNGGINFSDEYINIGSRFGHWKDTAVMLQGEAAQAFTLMFLQMWNLDGKDPVAYHANDSYIHSENGSGYVMPYGDCPLDQNRVGERVYLDIISRSRRYVHIMTPYLILDQETENALCYAAARGVDVQLLLPGIPDKKAVFALSRSHYKTLTEAGVKIWEYTPGFVHAKVLVSDGREAVVGTINFDYRSFYHHFECATYMHSVPCITQIEDDFQSCALKSRLVTHKQVKWYWKIAGYFMKVFSPLM